MKSSYRTAHDDLEAQYRAGIITKEEFDNAHALISVEENPDETDLLLIIEVEIARTRAEKIQE